MAFVPIYIVILAGTIIIDYAAGILIENAHGPRRKALLAVSIVANVGILCVFKYYNFFATNINGVFAAWQGNVSLPLLKILLPIGLSFHTFQAMSYTIEVYRGNQKPERHFGIYALYVMFYPQLVAGPIERPQNVLYQFHEKHIFSFDDLREGLKLMLWGFFKKIVIADRLSLTVNEVYNHSSHYNGVAFCLATIFFTFQIYCDFSGYSDIALGTARIMGIHLMENFKRPYFSKSIGEFWTRWHISLSTWFRDYLYIPLGGSRVKVSRHYLNLAIVFLVSGFWHGANWTFIIWGALHAFYLISELLIKRVRGGKARSTRFSRLSSVFVTFICVSFAWIFFRANTLKDASYVICHLASGWKETASIPHIKLLITDLGKGSLIQGLSNVIIGFIMILFLEFVQWRTRGERAIDWANKKPRSVRWGFYYFLVLSILLLGVFDNKEFIYFQF
jgi:D-alanyl-lipoteichoic acid acyltransferase DltB (MBOAT superfamily)